LQFDKNIGQFMTPQVLFFISGDIELAIKHRYATLGILFRWQVAFTSTMYRERNYSFTLQ
jgi:hypothetical protein